MRYLKFAEWAGPRPRWHHRIRFVVSAAMGYLIGYLALLFAAIVLGLGVTSLAAVLVWLTIAISGMVQ